MKNYGAIIIFIYCWNSWNEWISFLSKCHIHKCAFEIDVYVMHFMHHVNIQRKQLGYLREIWYKGTFYILRGISLIKSKSFLFFSSIMHFWRALISSIKLTRSQSQDNMCTCNWHFIASKSSDRYKKAQKYLNLQWIEVKKITEN